MANCCGGQHGSGLAERLRSELDVAAAAIVNPGRAQRAPIASQARRP